MWKEKELSLKDISFPGIFWILFIFISLIRIVFFLVIEYDVNLMFFYTIEFIVLLSIAKYMSKKGGKISCQVYSYTTSILRNKQPKIWYFQANSNQKEEFWIWSTENKAK
ncbi:MAG: hypothetical protein U9Q66_00665 [Patescibacteria group bacterium]|nr:hypothetical protein [Patescibacteria group bacterium]